MAIYIEEFLYRGKAPSSGATEAWHVILGNETDNGFGGKAVAISDPMSPAQAATAGFPLPVILAAINTAIMDQLTASQAQTTTLQAQLDALQTQNDQLHSQIIASKPE